MPFTISLAPASSLGAAILRGLVALTACFEAAHSKHQRVVHGPVCVLFAFHFLLQSARVAAPACAAHADMWPARALGTLCPRLRVMGRNVGREDWRGGGPSYPTHISLRYPKLFIKPLMEGQSRRCVKRKNLVPGLVKWSRQGYTPSDETEGRNATAGFTAHRSPRRSPHRRPQ